MKPSIIINLAYVLFEWPLSADIVSKKYFFSNVLCLSIIMPASHHGVPYESVNFALI